MKALFMSGYPRDTLVADGRVQAGIELLEKPFTPEALLRRTRDALDAPHGVSDPPREVSAVAAPAR